MLIWVLYQAKSLVSIVEDLIGILYEATTNQLQQSKGFLWS